MSSEAVSDPDGEIPAWLARALEFGSQCLREEPDLEPLDVVMLTCHAASALAVPAMAPPQGLGSNSIKAAMLTALAVVGAHPAIRLLARLDEVDVASPGDGLDAVARSLWAPYWAWWGKAFGQEEIDDPRGVAARRRFAAFCDQQLPARVKQEEPLRCFRGALGQLKRRTGISSSELMGFDFRLPLSWSGQMSGQSPYSLTSSRAFSRVYLA